jgi:hypothetical protein
VSIHRYDAKRDENEPQIVTALRACGVKVYRELPVDLLCWYPARQRFFVADVKTPKGRITPRQERFFAEVDPAPAFILRSLEDVQEALEDIRLWR